MRKYLVLMLALLLMSGCALGELVAERDRLADEVETLKASGADPTAILVLETKIAALDKQIEEYKAAVVAGATSTGTAIGGPAAGVPSGIVGAILYNLALGWFRKRKKP